MISFPADAISSDVIKNLARCQVPNLVLENIDGAFQSDAFIENSFHYISKNLISLSLKGSSITESTFIKILSKCHSLEALDVSCCNSLFMTGVLLSKQDDFDVLQQSLSNVRELNLSSIRYLSDSLFHRITSVCQNLKKLHLAGNQIIFHTDAIYIRRQSKINQKNTAVFTFASVLDMLEERATGMTSLSFSRTTIDENSLECLARIPGLVLEELYLVNCRELDESGIIKFCKHQRNLLVLDVSQCMMLGDGAMRTICSTQPRLMKLSVNKLHLCDNAFSQLDKLKNIQHLDLSSCHIVTHKALADTLLKINALKLTHLNLNCCSSVKDPFIVEAGSHLSQLTDLDLSSTGITNWGIVLVSKFMTQLRSLRLAWCRHLTDTGLLGQVDSEVENHPDDCECRCHKPPESTIFRKPSKYRKPSSHTLEQMEQVLALTGDNIYPLSELCLLERLDLTACAKITDNSLLVILPRLLYLQSLKLAMCSQLTDETLHVIARHNMILEELDISNNLKYTDRGVMTIAQRLRRLTHLNISNCDGLSDSSVHAVRRHCRWLKCLNVSMNIQITDEAVEHLENGLQHLQQLQKRMIGKTANNKIPCD